MTYVEELFAQMSNSLNISKLTSETEDNFKNRVLYSAIANWIYVTTSDVSFEENYNKHGISKSYITRRVSRILEEYLELFPTFHFYLGALSASEVISKIRIEMERAGFLTSTGFDEYIEIASSKSLKINEVLYLIRGSVHSEKTTAVGLGVYHDSSKLNNVSLGEMFYTPQISAANWTKEYIRQLNWKYSSKHSEQIEYFDPCLKDTFSRCWGDQFPENVEVTIYKRHDWDYGFARKIESNITRVQIHDYLIGTESTKTDILFDNDVYRFMYGLKAIHHNKVYARLEAMGDSMRLKLYNALPSIEQVALQFMGWKQKDVGDNYHYLIPLDLVTTVKELLGNLNITIEEK